MLFCIRFLNISEVIEMPKLDYSKFIHRDERLKKGYSVRNSFYIQKGNGRAGSYKGAYKGDFSVFRATRPVLKNIEES